MSIIPSKIEIDFTEERISPSAGSVFLSAMAEKMGLREELSSNIKLKKRARGSTDAEMLLSLIYSLAQGDGAILDVDRLGHDRTRCELPLKYILLPLLATVTSDYLGKGKVFSAYKNKCIPRIQQFLLIRESRLTR